MKTKSKVPFNFVVRNLTKPQVEEIYDSFGVTNGYDSSNARHAFVVNRSDFYFCSDIDTEMMPSDLRQVTFTYWQKYLRNRLYQTSIGAQLRKKVAERPEYISQSQLAIISDAKYLLKESVSYIHGYAYCNLQSDYSHDTIGIRNVSGHLPVELFEKLKCENHLVYDDSNDAYILKEEAVIAIVYIDEEFDPDEEDYFSTGYIHMDDVVQAEINDEQVNISSSLVSRLGWTQRPDGVYVPIPYEQPNGTYHSDQRGACDMPRIWTCKKSTKFTVGFEIEKEDFEAYPIGYKKLYAETKWCKESDGSLNIECGYELITPIYDLFSDKMDRDIENSEKLQRLINADSSDSCGGHINLASNIYSPIQIFWGIKGFFPLIYSMYPNRVSDEQHINGKTNYARTKTVDKYINDTSGNRKYSAFHLKEKVLEVRIVSAVKSVKNLLWRRDLFRIIMDNINASEKEVFKMLLDEESALSVHMRKVYSPEKMRKKCRQFLNYCEMFNNIHIEPNSDNIDDSGDDVEDLA